ncbi:segregation and condensation protein B [Clostridium tepidiprofundi DSM 19306]|uniref:Segregation and condensation protein B n=1 Tax=Clostridium tepidiprofundi DSM 19306 TaxID=1121338 RepID=A0A151B749_9CLOT|nr:SMC-Scp complex subunit ScpB [Clostridium tepidiprofundi]KYH35714.1 segregation and condensation protein B [Clostridium tepidiprofundi DSM 19306]
MSDEYFSQIEIEGLTNKTKYFSVIESLLFVSGDSLKLKDISKIIECSDSFTKKLMDELIHLYEVDNSRGIKIIRINDSYQLVTKPNNSTFIKKLLNKNSRQSLSQAALETLAIIAYKQPITKLEIDEIRGVKSDRAITTLLNKKLIKENGKLDVPGRPLLYITSEEFLKHFQLENLNQMPKLESFDVKEDNIGENIDKYIEKTLHHK